MIQQQLRSGSVLPENRNACKRRQMELGLADCHGLAQTGAQRRQAALDRFAIRGLEHQGQQTVAQLSQIPIRLAVLLHRQAQDHGAHDLLRDARGNDLCDIGYSIQVDDRHGYRRLSQSSERCGLLETFQEAAPIQLRARTLVRRFQSRIVSRNEHRANHAQRTVGSLRTDSHFVFAAVVEPGLQRGTRGDGLADELRQQRGRLFGPQRIDGLAAGIRGGLEIGDTVPAAMSDDDSVAPHHEHQVRKIVDQ